MLSKQQTFDALEAAKSGSDEAKTKLVEENAPLVKSIVKRYLNKGVEYEDLYQIGLVGLVKAIRNFDTSFGVQFSTYAVPMIAGEIKRYLRDNGSIKVSRSIKQQFIIVNKYIEKYTEINKKTPTIKHLAEKFSMEKNEMVFVLESNKRPLYLYQKLENGESNQLMLDKISTEDEYEEKLEKMQVLNALKSLDEREKKIILLRFYRDKTQAEVAKILGVSQVQISRLEKKVLQSLKQQIAIENDL